MPIFDASTRSEELWPASKSWPLRRARAIVARFQAEFPEIHYELAWDVMLPNAQAYVGEQGRAVRVFGGLARRRDVGLAGLAFAIAHETGHHLGGAPRHPFLFALSSEARANEWAVEEGLPRMFDHVKSRHVARVGIRQLKSLWSLYATSGDHDFFQDLQSSESRLGAGE
jgi:hypothetical protein